jgi:hypothetical protein
MSRKKSFFLSSDFETNLGNNYEHFPQRFKTIWRKKYFFSKQKKQHDIQKIFFFSKNDLLKTFRFEILDTFFCLDIWAS